MMLEKHVALLLNFKNADLAQLTHISWGKCILELCKF